MKKAALMAAALIILAPAAFAGNGDAPLEIARAFDGPYDDFVFRVAGTKVLLVDMDADVLQTRGPGEHGHEATYADGGGVEAPCQGGGCSGGNEGGGCSGGPGGFCLQVLNQRGDVLCWAERPRRPGWMRDPILACLLEGGRGAVSYTLRVSLRDEDCGDAVYATPEIYQNRLYLLRVSIYDAAPEGTVGPLPGQGRH